MRVRLVWPSIAPSGIETQLHLRRPCWLNFLQSHLRVLKPDHFCFDRMNPFSFNRTFGYWNQFLAPGPVLAPGPSIAPSGIETHVWEVVLGGVANLQSHLRVLKLRRLVETPKKMETFNRTFGYWNINWGFCDFMIANTFNRTFGYWNC